MRLLARLAPALALLAARSAAVAVGVSSTPAGALAAEEESHRDLGLHHNDAARLLQRASAKHLRSPSPDFFAEDSHRMAELPGYDNKAYQRAKEPPTRDILCMPQCRWKCGPSPKCDQVCQPACAPPKCQTLCERREDKCETRCGPPQCAVVCPHNDCAKPPCAKCMTVCSPPQCTTECGEVCQNVCAKPTCSWKCHQTLCPKPKCELSCDTAKSCNVTWPSANETETPEAPGEVATVYGMASMDPAMLTKPVTAPPSWDVTTTTVAPLVKAADTAASKLAAKLAASAPRPGSAASEPGAAPPGLRVPNDPVHALKLRWAAEDARR